MSALRRFLPDFDAAASPARRAPLPAPVRPLFAADPPPPADAIAPAPPAVDAVAEAVALALAEAGRAQASALDALAASHAAELAAARARWAAAEGAALADGFRAAVAALGDAIGDAAGAALQPLFGEGARRLAAAGLRDAVGDLVLAGAGEAIAVSGPADLLEALRAALAADGVAVGAMRFAASDAAEVVVVSGESRIETRVGAFAEALRRRLGGAERAPGPGPGAAAEGAA